MAVQLRLQARFGTWKRNGITRCSNDSKEKMKVKEAELWSPAEELAKKFERRLLVGIGSASLVALGANFGGITSFFLGLSPQNGRKLKLDVLYPIGGFTRYIDTREGFGNFNRFTTFRYTFYLDITPELSTQKCTRTYPNKICTKLLTIILY
jgi:hypothetical protein